MKIPANQYKLVIDSPIGRLGVLIVNEQIHRLDYLDDSVHLNEASSTFEHETVQQLQCYFETPGMSFNLPFELTGTSFQQQVWQALTLIPTGETFTYGELAASIGSGARAVGNACRHNPVSIIVPCHRVVAASGIGGYSGKTDGPVLDRKRWLLQHESQLVPALKRLA